MLKLLMQKIFYKICYGHGFAAAVAFDGFDDGAAYDDGIGEGAYFGELLRVRNSKTQGDR